MAQGVGFGGVRFRFKRRWRNLVGVLELVWVRVGIVAMVLEGCGDVLDKERVWA